MGDGLGALPNWLPSMAVVEPWTTHTFDALHEIYLNTISHAALFLDGQRVWFYRDLEDGREIMFWHLTHRKDKSSNTRLPDLPRCRKLTWVAAILDNANQPEVTRWDYLESDGKINTYLWLQAEQCLVLLRKFEDGTHRLITCYHVDSGTHRSLTKKYGRRLK